MTPSGRVKEVLGPRGEIVTLSSIPIGNPRRWLPQMKARVVAAIDGGLISMDEASRRYHLSREEYEAWREELPEEAADEAVPLCFPTLEARRSRPGPARGASASEHRSAR